MYYSLLEQIVFRVWLPCEVGLASLHLPILPVLGGSGNWGVSECIQSAASTRWFYLTAYSSLLLRQYPLEEMLATANFGFTKSSRQSQACPGIWTLGGEGCYKIRENMDYLRNVYIKMC